MFRGRKRPPHQRRTVASAALNGQYAAAANSRRARRTSPGGGGHAAAHVWQERVGEDADARQLDGREHAAVAERLEEQPASVAGTAGERAVSAHGGYKRHSASRPQLPPRPILDLPIAISPTYAVTHPTSYTNQKTFGIHASPDHAAAHLSTCSFFMLAASASAVCIASVVLSRPLKE